jgi:Rrf2 family protein
VRISAKADYALRAAAELAGAAAEGDGGGPVKAERLASAQGIPMKFLQSILAELRLAGIVRSQRGSEGGWWLAKPAADVTLADVVRAVEGPLATVRGQRPHELEYTGAATELQSVWIAVRASLRGVLETVTLADLAAGRLPPEIVRISENPEAWLTR